MTEDEYKSARDVLSAFSRSLHCKQLAQAAIEAARNDTRFAMAEMIDACSASEKYRDRALQALIPVLEEMVADEDRLMESLTIGGGILP